MENIVSQQPNVPQANSPIPQSPSQQLQQQMINKTPMSGKTLAIGCGVFVILFALIIIVALLSALQNPSSLDSMGIDADTVKTVVKGIILLVAIIFFFVGFGLSIWSGYRLFTKKEGNKLGYIGGLILGLIFVIGAIGGGSAGIIKIDNLDTSGTTGTAVVNPYLVVKQTTDRRVKKGKIYLGEPGLKIIAPANISFKFNQDTFNRTVGTSLGGTLQSIVLDCGNGQMIDSARVSFDADLFFGQSCLYLTKGSYTPSIIYRYIDSVTRQLKESAPVAMSQFDIHTQIDLSTKNGAYRLNDSKNEIIIGENPTQLLVDATKIATDLGLVNSIISWDLDEDGKEDKQRVNFSYYYYTPKLHTLSYSLPDYPGIVYQFPVRVNQSNVPGCTVGTQLIKGNQYRLDVKLADAGVNIDNYQFEVVDSLTDDIVDQIDSEKSTTVYDFAPGRQYQVRAFFTTDDGKQGVCETDDLAVNNSSYTIKSTISVKYPNSSSFTELASSGDVNQVTITTVPAQLQLKINEIIPEAKNAIVTTTLDGTKINPSSQQTYMFKIDNKKNHTLVISVEDQGKVSKQQYLIVSDVSPIIGVLKADKKVGFDPLTVTFDASISQLNDANDEVVYFTWDFGDGTIVKNVSQGSIKHAYRFAENNESGSYRPKVTVTTQKGHTDTIELSDDIIVKRAIRDVQITSPTHPAQMARVGDKVEFALQTDGVIKSVSWDFGNNQTITEDGRAGTETQVTYAQAGTYDVTAVVEFNDHPPVTQNMKIKVN